MDILVLNTNFEHVAIVDTFNSLIWADRYDEYGDFEIECPMDTKWLDIFKEDYYLWIKESDHMMIIEDITIDANVEDGNYMRVTGRSLESILERRIVWGQTTMSGNLHNAIKTLIDEAIIVPKIEDRKIPNFVFEDCTDERVTSLTVDMQYTGENLHYIISNLCKKNKIGFKIILNDNNEFVFSLYAGTDRSYDQTTNPYVIFSPKFENMINSNFYTSKASFKNVTLVAGEGEGVNRKSATVGSASGLDRRELYTDAGDISSTITEDEQTSTRTIQTRDVYYGYGDVSGGTDDFSTDVSTTKTMSDAEYTALLETRGSEKLADYPVKTAFEGEIEAVHMFKYGEDFFVGDIVQITDDYGHEGVVYISELIVSQSGDGVSVRPTFKTIDEEEGEE